MVVKSMRREIEDPSPERVRLLTMRATIALEVAETALEEAVAIAVQRMPLHEAAHADAARAEIEIFQDLGARVSDVLRDIRLYAQALLP